jgi:serine/threonine protein kinase
MSPPPPAPPTLTPTAFFAERKLEPFRFVLRALIPPFTALALLHSADVVHADVRPENLLVREGPNGLGYEIVLADFSNAFPLRFASLYAGSSELQTLLYRAPEVQPPPAHSRAETEQVLLGLPLTVDIDVWSAGCVIFEVLSRQRLFTPTDDADLLKQILALIGPPPPEITQHATRLRHLLPLNAPVEAPSKCCARLAVRLGLNEPWLLDVISKCLQWHQRPSVGEVVDAIVRPPTRRAVIEEQAAASAAARAVALKRGGGGWGEEGEKVKRERGEKEGGCTDDVLLL